MISGIDARHHRLPESKGSKSGDVFAVVARFGKILKRARKSKIQISLAIRPFVSFVVLTRVTGEGYLLVVIGYQKRFKPPVLQEAAVY